MVDKQQHKRAAEARYNIILGNRKSYWNAQSNQYNLVSVDEHVRISRYGLGNKRTLDQFIAFTGIDTRNRLVFENKCGKQNKWVEFAVEQNGDANIDSIDIWGYAAETLKSVNHEHEFVLHGNSIPLVSSGTKKRLHIQSFPSTGVETEAVASLIPEIPPVKLVHEETILDAIWESYVGFWFDDWVIFTEQLIAAQIAENPHENSIKVTKLLLILFPVLICIFVAALYPSLSDSGGGEKGSPDRESPLSDLRSKKGKKLKYEKAEDFDGGSYDSCTTPLNKKTPGSGSTRGSSIASHSAKKVRKAKLTAPTYGSPASKEVTALITPPRPDKSSAPTSP